MEKFILIFQGTRGEESPEQQQRQRMKWFNWVDKLKSQGKYLAGEGLLPGGKVVSGLDKLVTDGPFTETKDMIGGFFLINAANYAEAVEISKDCPDFEFGTRVLVMQCANMRPPVGK